MPDRIRAAGLFGKRRKLGDEQRAQMDAMFDKLEAAQANSAPAPAADDHVSQLDTPAPKNGNSRAV